MLIILKDAATPEEIGITMTIMNDNRTVRTEVRDRLSGNTVMKSFDQHFRNRDRAECSIEATANMLIEVGGEVISE